jgi:hypothetical protein
VRRLLDLAMTRSAEIEGDVQKLLARDAAGQPATPERARALIASVFGEKELACASWIPALPLPAQLSARKPLTVDVAPNLLAFMEQNYGVNWYAICRFARAGLIRLNIRDFNPNSPDPEQELTRYADFENELIQLFDEAPNSIYYLGSLRKFIFEDKRLGGEITLEEAFSESAALGPIGAAVDARNFRDPDILRNTFRGERVEFIQTRWHWAYLRIYRKHLPPQTTAYLDLTFARLSAAPPDNRDAQGDFIAFAMQLRHLHLIYTAPLTAAFGGEYCMRLGDEYAFCQAIDYSNRTGEEIYKYDYVNDELLDYIYNIQLSRISPRLKTENDNRHLEILRTLGIRAFCRAGNAPHYNHYSIDENINEVILYFEDSIVRDGAWSQLDATLDEALADVDNLKLGDLASIAAEFAALQIEDATALARFTEGHQVILSPSPGLPSRYDSVIVDVNPKAMNLAASYLSRVSGVNYDRSVKIGGCGDYRRRLLHSFQMFRRPPS